MRLDPSWHRRILLACAAITVAVALVLALGVIPPVNAEVARGATPEKAVSAFWLNIGLNLLSSSTLALLATRSESRSWISTSVLVIVGLIVLFLGLALLDAASAYMGHGQSMRSASILLFFCAAADFLTGVTVVAAALLRPKSTQ